MHVDKHVMPELTRSQVIEGVSRRAFVVLPLMFTEAALAQSNDADPNAGVPRTGSQHASLDDLIKQISRHHPYIRSALVLRDGHRVLEFYRDGLDEKTLHATHFITASFVSTLVGIALRQGRISSVNQPLSDFLPEALGEAVDSRVRSITLEQVLTLTAGFDPSVRQVGRVAFPIDFALQRRLTSPPGETFSFSPGTAHLAARVLVRATGRSLSSYAREHLFEPLGIDRYLWRLDRPGGGELGYSGLEMTSRDIAKLGQLYLQDGVWSRKTVISVGYAATATRKHNSGGAPLNVGYGYLWWVGTRNASSSAFTAGANDGQRLYVDRRAGIVAVVTSDNLRKKGASSERVDLVLNDLVSIAART